MLGTCGNCPSIKRRILEGCHTAPNSEDQAPLNICAPRSRAHELRLCAPRSKETSATALRGFAFANQSCKTGFGAEGTRAVLNDASNVMKLYDPAFFTIFPGCAGWLARPPCEVGNLQLLGLEGCGLCTRHSSCKPMEGNSLRCEVFNTAGQLPTSSSTASEDESPSWQKSQTVVRSRLAEAKPSLTGNKNKHSLNPPRTEAIDSRAQDQSLQSSRNTRGLHSRQRVCFDPSRDAKVLTMSMQCWITLQV